MQLFSICVAMAVGIMAGAGIPLIHLKLPPYCYSIIQGGGETNRLIPDQPARLVDTRFMKNFEVVGYPRPVEGDLFLMWKSPIVLDARDHMLYVLAAIPFVVPPLLLLLAWLAEDYLQGVANGGDR